MTPSAPRLVAVWVPDWPVVALTLEARERAPAGRVREVVPDRPWPPSPSSADTAWSPPPRPRAPPASPPA